MAQDQGTRGLSLRSLLIVCGLGLALAVSLWVGHVPLSGTSEPPAEEQARIEGEAKTPPEPADKPSPPGEGIKATVGHPVDKPTDDPGSFLDSFTAKDTAPNVGGPAPDNDTLEKRWRSLVADRKRLQTAAATPAEKDRLDKTLNALQTDLRTARRARPNDPVVQWLIGELFLFVGGEPDLVLPYFRRAVDAGLDRPILYVRLADAQFWSNQFADAYASALKGVERSRDPEAWTMFQRAAFARHEFKVFVDRLDKTFPAPQPRWAHLLRREAADLEAKWRAEQKLRQAEARANNLPRVRLVIEHRRFARDPDVKSLTGPTHLVAQSFGAQALAPLAGPLAPMAQTIVTAEVMKYRVFALKPLTTIKRTGKEEVILELFEDQAPVTVANFLDLVQKHFYDGTRFHLAAAGAMVVGGDPKSKSADPADDGSGGPGYAIPDEYTSPKARYPFGGALGMVNMGKPGTAGSQFFLTLVPRPEFAGHFTVFGRVLKGQNAVDRTTRGRTNAQVGAYGKIIPGDLLLRAEVVRKRPHEYRVIKTMK